MDAPPPAPPAIVAPAPSPASPAGARARAPASTKTLEQPPAAGFASATDIRPRTDEEKELCARGSNPDWLYLSGLVALDVGSIVAHAWLKQEESQFVRTLGAGFIGFSWGATLGGGRLSIPTCDRNWVWSPPPEGEVRSHWPLTLALTAISAVSAPFVVGVVTGPLPINWTYSERTSRLYFASGAAALGSLLPHLSFLSPAPWRAKRELERIRYTPMVGGGVASYTLTF